MYETCDQRKGRIFTDRPVSCPVKQPSAGGKSDLVVVVDLERGLGNTAFLDGLHVVIPLVDPLIRGFPIRCPGKVGRVDVGGHTVLKAMHLVRPDKMHLAGQAGPVAEGLEIMRKSRDGGLEFRGVVIGGDAADELAGHEGKA